MRTRSELIAALQSRKGEWPTLARAADVSYSWLTKFAQGHIPNPGINTMQKVESVLDAGIPQ